MSTPLFDRMKTAAASLTKDGRAEGPVMVDAMAIVENMVGQLAEGMRIAHALREKNRYLVGLIEREKVLVAETIETLESIPGVVEQEDESETAQ